MRNLVWLIVAAVVLVGGYVLFTGKSPQEIVETVGETVSTPESLESAADAAGEALENAAAVVAASGGSTNAALHLPAIAHECGITFDLFDVAEIFKRTPYRSSRYEESRCRKI